MGKKLIRFDWAIKKILRNKANFDILEGFLSELFRFDVTIENILEGESNQENAEDKYNRVDLLVKNHLGELILVEVQNEPQTDFFHRMVYGASKLVVEYLKVGDPYANIKKVFSVNIVYFGLGQGNDYVYEYQSGFVGMHNQETLAPTLYQREKFHIEHISDIFPKYYILKVNNFNDVAEDTLDEWIYFLKNSEVLEGFRAKGLDKAKEKLQYEGLSEEEKRIYRRYQENVVIAEDVMQTAKREAAEAASQAAWEAALEVGIEEGRAKGLEEGREKGLEEGREKGLEEGREEGAKLKAIGIAKKGIQMGLDNEAIVQLTGLTEDEIQAIRAEN